MKRFPSQYNPPKRHQGMYETPKGESQTVPNETLTIKQIMVRAMNGHLPVEHHGQYMPVSHIDKVTKFHRPLIDQTELEELREQNKDREQQIADFQKARSEELEKAKKVAKEEAEEEPKKEQ